MNLPAPLQAEIDKLNYLMEGIPEDDFVPQLRRVIRQLMEHIEKVEKRDLVLQENEYMKKDLATLKKAWLTLNDKYTALRQAGDALRYAVIGITNEDSSKIMLNYTAICNAIANYDKLTTQEN